MSDTPPTGAEWTEAIVKALHLGYLDALDDVQDRAEATWVRSGATRTAHTSAETTSIC
jgi:hypothetical protein